MLRRIQRDSLTPSFDEDGNETGYYTREPDGISGMTGAALATFVGVDPPAITSLLNKIEKSDPLTNDLVECLKPLVGKDLRLLTNDLQGRKIIPDEVCQAISEYYAFDARDYKGKQTAIRNFRVASKASMRVSKTAIEFK